MLSNDRVVNARGIGISQNIKLRIICSFPATLKYNGNEQDIVVEPVLLENTRNIPNSPRFFVYV